MNLKSLPDQALLIQTEELVNQERRITTSILWHLYEIERRRLHAELGFDSLFDYCTEKLKYSESGAQRRISAMRLLREMPEIASKINTGDLNVSAISQAQSVFRQARLENKAFNLDAKKELIERLENKSYRECRKILAEVNPVQSRPSQERVISPTKTEIRFEVDDALYAKIKKLKGLFAHKLKGSSDIKDLVELLVDQAIEKAEPKTKKLLPTSEVGTKDSTNPKTSNQRRYIPKAIRVKAWREAQGQCSYVNPQTGKRCNSQYALEYDHKTPLALGGKTEAENIRLLCRTHNQHAAVRALGYKKMGRYLASFTLTKGVSKNIDHPA